MSKETLNFSHSSYSDLKRVAYEGGCPKKWYEGWVNKNKPEPSEPMLLGRLFEQLCGVAEEDGIIIPTTRTGGTPVKWARVVKQADIFCEFFDPKSPYWKGWEIVEHQIVMHDKDRNEKGVIDCLAIGQDEWVDEVCLARWELKSTSDLTNSFGDYQWADLERRDWLQPLIYGRLWDNLKLSEKYLKKYKVGTIVDRVYVADVSPRMNKKIIPLDITPQGIATVQKEVDLFWDMVNHYSKEGWFVDGSPRNCKNCPLKDNCSGFVDEEKDKEEEPDMYNVIIESPITI